MPFLIEKLVVYQKALDLAEELGALTDAFPRGQAYVVDQLNRAALSIATNIAEGNGRYRKLDRRNFFIISRGSAFECVPILELCRRKGLINAEQHRLLYQRLEEISKMLSGLINSLPDRLSFDTASPAARTSRSIS